MRSAPTGAVVFEARAPARARVRGWARSARPAAARARAPTAASVLRPSSARRAAVFGPMPGTSPGGAAAKRAQACSRLSTTKPAGFSASEATLATSLLGPMPTEHVSCVVLRDLGDEPAHGGARREQAVEVEVGLVEPDDLHALDVRAHDRHHPRGDLTVGGEVGRAGRPRRGTAAAPRRRASRSRRRSGAPRSWRW